MAIVLWQCCVGTNGRSRRSSRRSGSRRSGRGRARRSGGLGLLAGARVWRHRRGASWTLARRTCDRSRRSRKRSGPGRSGRASPRRSACGTTANRVHGWTVGRPVVFAWCVSRRSGGGRSDVKQSVASGDCQRGVRQAAKQKEVGTAQGSEEAGCNAQKQYVSSHASTRKANETLEP